MSPASILTFDTIPVPPDPQDLIFEINEVSLPDLLGIGPHDVESHTRALTLFSEQHSQILTQRIEETVTCRKFTDDDLAVILGDVFRGSTIVSPRDRQVCLGLYFHNKTDSVPYLQGFHSVFDMLLRVCHDDLIMSSLCYQHLMNLLIPKMSIPKKRVGGTWRLNQSPEQHQQIRDLIHCLNPEAARQLETLSDVGMSSWIMGFCTNLLSCHLKPGPWNWLMKRLVVFARGFAIDLIIMLAFFVIEVYVNVFMSIIGIGGDIDKVVELVQDADILQEVMDQTKCETIVHRMETQIWMPHIHNLLRKKKKELRPPIFSKVKKKFVSNARIQ